MILARNKAAPLRFVLGVTTAWVVLRGVMLSGIAPFAPRQMVWAAGPGWLASHLLSPPPAAASDRPVLAGFARPKPSAPVRGRRFESPLRVGADTGDATMRLLSLAGPGRPGPGSYARATAAHEAAAVTTHDGLAPALAAGPRSASSRWSGSGWAFVRGGGFARPLSPDGQIGAGQAGIRILYRVAGRLSASARVSRTIGGPDQTEAALGLDWQPVRRIPVHLTLERRIAIDPGGRNAIAAGAAGGVYAVPLAPDWRLDGYAEGGLVGAHRRDLYADGAIRAGRAIAFGDGRSLTLGLGAWGAAQPGAARLDAGPSVVLRLPVAARTIGVALDYRARLLGDARPHSGVALTVGVDF